MRRCMIFILIFLFFSVSIIAASANRGISLKPVAPSGETVAGNQWLLIIGIDSYVTWPRLATAVNDAKAVRDVLLDRYHFDKDHLIELYDADATRKEILSSLRTLAKKVKPEDSLFIFYAGHGHLDPITKAGSWIPVESGIDDSSAWIDNQKIKNYLKADAIKARHVLLVSDSCFAGDFFRGQRGNLPEVTDIVIKKAYQRDSRQAITSGGVEPVSDAGFGGNSVFSHFFVSALKKNDTPYLIPSALFPEVKSGVAQNAEQFPQFGSLHGVGGQDGGEFVFFLKQVNRLLDLSSTAKDRQQELEHLRHLEIEAKQAKKEEQAEINKIEAELAEMDARIAAMKKNLGHSVDFDSNDSLKAMLAMVEQKKNQQLRLNELKRQRIAEESKREQEIDSIKNEKRKGYKKQALKDVDIYKKIISLSVSDDIKKSAWNALVEKYPSESKNIDEGNTDALLIKIEWEVDQKITNSFGIEFIFIPPSVQKIATTKGYYLGKTEITHKQWTNIMGSNPSSFQDCGEDCPIENVSYEQVQDFVLKLNKIGLLSRICGYRQATMS